MSEIDCFWRSELKDSITLSPFIKPPTKSGDRGSGIVFSFTFIPLLRTVSGNEATRFPLLTPTITICIVSAMLTNVRIAPIIWRETVAPYRPSSHPEAPLFTATAAFGS